MRNRQFYDNLPMASTNPNFIIIRPYDLASVVVYLMCVLLLANLPREGTCHVRILQKLCSIGKVNFENDWPRRVLWLLPAIMQWDDLKKKNSFYIECHIYASRHAGNHYPSKLKILTHWILSLSFLVSSEGHPRFFSVSHAKRIVQQWL